MSLTALRTAFLLVAACDAFGQPVVVPNSQATAPGNLALPVGSKANRFQQIIGSGQFFHQRCVCRIFGPSTTKLPTLVVTRARTRVPILP
jgi:hypothetical protein